MLRPVARAPQSVPGRFALKSGGGFPPAQRLMRSRGWFRQRDTKER